MKPTTATWGSQLRLRSPASWQISTPHRWPNGRTCFGRCFRGCVMTGCTRSYATAWSKLSLRNQALSTSAKISRDPATFEAGRPLEGHGWIIGVASAPAQRHLSPRPTAPSPPSVHPRGRAFSLGANTVFQRAFCPAPCTYMEGRGHRRFRRPATSKRQRRKVAQDRSTVPQLRSHHGGPVRRYPHHRTCTSTRCECARPR